ncbi:hypothetical protein DVH24_011732 [Malus domestica]|uniref:Uncharacterized protein n=1 Tax=Malus domestica TaxID=3750 RepID=A0A498JWS8_MALDO|nr:hypothetical protein DVH24_011732 [Malus domestica]
MPLKLKDDNKVSNVLRHRLGSQELTLKKMDVTEMRMLRWICGHTRKDKIKNEDIRGNISIRWFGHMKQRSTNTSVRKCDCETEAQGKRGRRRPRKTWKETLRKYIEYLDLMEDLVQNQAQLCILNLVIMHLEFKIFILFAPSTLNLVMSSHNFLKCITDCLVYTNSVNFLT